MEMMVYNYGQTKSKEDKTKMLHKGARQILIGFFPLKWKIFLPKVPSRIGGYFPPPYGESSKIFLP